jgi:DsbE subfamily thiol:disulfide oxidoreductase
MTTLLRRFGLPVMLSLVAIPAGCGGASKEAKSTADESGEGGGHAEVGKKAPDLTIQTLNGKGTFSLASVKGKPVIVDFWATWCGPCKESFPKLEELSKRLGDKVEIIGISVDDEKKGVLEFAKENGATFAIGWDEGHVIAARWKVGTMPTTFIVDGEGTVRFIHDGYHDGETKQMEKEIVSLWEDKSSGEKLAKSSEESEKKDEAAEKKDETASAPSTSSSEEAESEPPSPPPKKKGGKKGGKKGTKKRGKKKA